MITKSKSIKLVALLLTLAFLLAAVAGCSQTADKAEPPKDTVTETTKPAKTGGMPEKIVIGASEPGSSWYPMAAAMKEVLEKEYPGTRVDIFYGGGDVNLKAIEEKKIDFGITFSVSAADAKAGKGRFSTALNNVSGAMGLYLAALQMVTRPDSDIKSIADLKGKKISTGMQGYATTGIFEQILPLYGLTKEDVKWEYATAPDIGNMFKDKDLDFFAIHSTTTAPFPVIQDISVQTPIRLIGMEEDKLAQLMQTNPGHQKVVVPANLYKGQTEEVVTQGNVGMLAVRSDLPEDVVQNVVSALIKNADYLAKAVADLSYVSKDKSGQGLGIPLHPGAEKAFK